MKCEIFGCVTDVYNRLSIGPGTSTALCKDHFIEFKKELMPEYPKQENVVEIEVDSKNIPRAGALADLLQEWVTWTTTYGSLLEDVGGLNNLHQRSIGAVKKWGRDG